MLDRLTHRGPDGQGTHALEHAWLGHQRLAIVDPERGTQPLHDAEGTYWLVGDGEVYNHRRLRVGLEEKGHVFRSDSDHETVLHLIEEDGLAALPQLWGMFAFVVATTDGRFAAARDIIGLAPLYWVRDGDTVVFASELKAFDPPHRKSVEPFPPGHVWTPTDGLQPFGELPSAADTSTSFAAYNVEEDPPEEVLTQIRETLIASVKRSMAADVPVGALLSGGIDSSIVTAIAATEAKKQGWRLPTFSAGLADSEDLAAARRVAALYSTAHEERIYTEDELIDWVPEVIRVIESFDPTLVHSSVPNLLVAKLAARSVKVVLIGEGADELFAGYAYYRDFDSHTELHDELVATLEGLHIGGLQRVDRVTGSNSLEARTPFLDVEMVELGLGLPAQWKLSNGDRLEKWLLRKAFDGWLPEDLLWRPKQQFGQGTGSRDVLRQHYEATVSEEEFHDSQHVLDPPPRTREELAYFRLFERELTGLDPGDVVGRFTEA